MPKADDWAESPWMPPSPHKEAVLERLAKGRAHIEEQGHAKPPLLVYEDGGVIELHKARLGSWDLYSEDTAGAPEGCTKHVDVCGTIDEIEAWLKESPSGATDDPGRLEALLKHALHMCGRMQRRWAAYREFAGRVAEVAERLQAITGPDCDGPEAAAQGVREAGREGDTERTVAHAEAIRDVANALEKTLRQYRDAATELAALYEHARGARDWSKDVGERLALLRD
ncbi:MAG: hypothetical protein FJX75_24245 [Armatimonadetes bacterium]|nr:hypothetical protein [Armatimonadota bacterium]